MTSANLAFDELAGQVHLATMVPGGSTLSQLDAASQVPARSWTNEQLEAEFKAVNDQALGTAIESCQNTLSRVGKSIHPMDGGATAAEKLEKLRAEQERRRKSKAWLDQVGRARPTRACVSQLQAQWVTQVSQCTGQQEPGGGQAGRRPGCACGR